MSLNPNGIHLLEANPNKINWILKANPKYINWNWLLGNPSIFKIDIKQYKINITEKANILDNLLYKN